MLKRLKVYLPVFSSILWFLVKYLLRFPIFDERRYSVRQQSELNLLTILNIYEIYEMKLKL